MGGLSEYVEVADDFCVVKISLAVELYSFAKLGLQANEFFQGAPEFSCSLGVW